MNKWERLRYVETQYWPSGLIKCNLGIRVRVRQSHSGHLGKIADFEDSHFQKSSVRGVCGVWCMCVCVCVCVCVRVCVYG